MLNVKKGEGQLMKRDEVLRILIEQKSDFLRHYPISSLSVFGSVARDNARSDSDVDILVEFSQPVGLFMFIELQQRLESLIGCKVDLGTPRSLKPRIKASVLQEAIRVI
jgi:predicted nucleotidyltransferase